MAWIRRVVMVASVGFAMCAGLVWAEGSSASVRLVTALPNGERATVEELKSGRQLTEAKGVMFGDYVEVGWNTMLRVTWGSSGSVILPVPESGEDGRTLGTIFVASTGAVRLLWDLDASSPLRRQGVDMASVRLMNGGVEDAVDFFGVSVECHDCLRPPLGPRQLAPGATSDWMSIYGAHPWQVAAYGSNSSHSLLASGEAEEGAALPGWWLAALEPSTSVPGKTRGESQDVGAIGGVITTRFREHGVYSVLVTSSGVLVHEDVAPNAIWVPVVVSVVLLSLLAALVFRVPWGRACATIGCGAEAAEAEDGEKGKKGKSGGRVTAIDIFRGICLSIMIFVNYGGGGYWWLDHSRWDGLTVADLVFPSFVWTMGASMALSHAGMRKRLGADGADWRVPASWQTVVRGLKLVALGLFLNGGYDLSNWRFPGVLQYFGVSTIVVGLLDIWVPKWTEPEDPQVKVERSDEPPADASSLNASLLGEGDVASAPSSSSSPPAPSSPPASSGSWAWWAADFVGGDLRPYAAEWLVVLALEGVYLGLQYGMPVKGCPTGYTGPGGLGDFGKYPTCTGGAHRAIDMALFGGPHHVYHGVDANGAVTSAATCADTYRCAVFDPEGALGAISAVFMAFLGLQAGRIFLRARRAGSAPGALVARWLSAGLALGALGTALAGARQWGGAMPINKNLWSPSFIFVMSGISFCAVALLYVVADVRALWAGKPFLWLGMNSIVVYAGSEILQPYLPFSFELNDYTSSHALLLASNIIGVLCWCAIAAHLHANGIFVKL